MICVFHLTTIY